jgi:hypothetical protein
MIRFSLGFLLGVGLALNMPVAKGAETCAPRDKVMTILADKYGELPRSFMLINDQYFLETYVSEGGSWTLVRFGVDDIGCVIASGSDYTDYDIHFGQDF